MSIRQAADREPVPLRQAVAELVERADLIAALMRAGHELAAWMYRIGYEHGHDAGRREAEQEMDRAWRAVARPVAAGAGGELQRRRWAVRGQSRTRETFARPHPDDFPGKGAA